jgi:hypothetical protein
MQLSLDRREVRLSHALGEFPHVLVEMPVGDVLCEYTDGRESWVAERKTAVDLAHSIKTGRWSSQNPPTQLDEPQLERYPSELELQSALPRLILPECVL